MPDLMCASEAPAASTPTSHDKPALAEGDSHESHGFGGFIADALTGAGAIAHRLERPAEHFAESAGEEVGHLKGLLTRAPAIPDAARKLQQPLDPANYPGWLESKQPWQRPTGPTWMSPAEMEDVERQSNLSHARARFGLPGAEAKASGWETASNALSIGAAVGEGIEEYRESTAQTTAGKLADATIAGGIEYGVNKSPILRGADTVMGLGGMALGGLGRMTGSEGLVGAGEWLGENKPSHQLIGGMRGAVTAVEGLVTGDSTGMGNVHQQQLAGKQGWILQQAAQAGDFWARSDAGAQVAGSAKEAWGGVKDDTQAAAHALFGHWTE